jgi:hypothetical protein
MLSVFLQLSLQTADLYFVLPQFIVLADRDRYAATAVMGGQKYSPGSASPPPHCDS